MVQVGNELNSGMLWPNGKAGVKAAVNLTGSPLC
ncbi:hypothetical protein ACEQPO_29520 [Bacillus sp. SL00103]